MTAGYHSCPWKPGLTKEANFGVGVGEGDFG